MPVIYGRPDTIVNGQASAQFKNVASAFRKNFVEGFERDGAALAVFHRGQIVVDLWAGYADSESKKKWKADTRNILFSATKPVAALCIAVLADRGHLRWDDPVAKFWPAYAQHGKENTTIDHVLSHSAGVPYTDEELTYEDALHVVGALDKLARTKPLWQPGSESGYHAITYGWLIEGIVRGADPMHRDLATFFNEEIAEPFGLDMSIGVHASEQKRTASLTQPTWLEYIRDFVMDPRMFVMVAMLGAQPSSAPINRMQSNPSWIIFTPTRISFNEPEIQSLRIGAATGVATARDMARLFDLVIQGRIVSQGTVQDIRRPVLESWHVERTVMYPVMKGRGFFYDYHPQKWGEYTFGHPGYGCQSLHVDPVNELVVVYLTNGLKTATSYLCHPYQRVLQQVYRAL